MRTDGDGVGMKGVARAALLLALAWGGVSAMAQPTAVEMLPGEHWWGVANFFGAKMPFSAETKLSIDLRKDNFYNQSASFMVSDKGRVIWCARQCLFEMADGRIAVTPDAAGEEVRLVSAGATLREAFRHAARTYFPPSGKMPDPLFFSAPQYNTWIELTYHQNEKDILAYAQAMLDNGLPPGVFMIDDTWQAGYGDWRFEPTRFADPKGMVARLHAQGFKVILWMCPWVGMDTPAFRRLAWGYNPDDVRGWPTKGGFVTDPARKGAPAAVEWWNGYSAMLDLTHPNARAWFDETLDGLVRDFGVDGFKFDGGSVRRYALGYGVHDRTASSGEQCMAFARYSLRYPVCEYRNVWRLQGQPIVMRLHDKNHSWAHLRLLIPDMVAGGLLGYPFVCPDMIGGGQWVAFLPGSPFDPELFVRSAQVHALCGMMQFSASPWRVLDAAHQRIVRDLVRMRQTKFAAKFTALAAECGRTGEPMIRNLEYVFPGRGYAAVKDQFMMGDFLLVAPVVEKGATARKVVLPPGKWRADDGAAVVGPAEITVEAPLARLPYFEREAD